MVHIIVVEDEIAHAELIRRAFQDRQDQFDVSIVHSLAEARQRLGEATPDLVITDLMLPDGRGIELIAPEDDGPDYPVVVMTSHGDEKVAVEAIKAGALDYVVKSAETLGTMPHVAQRTLREWRQMRELERTQDQLRHAQKMEAIGNLSSGIAHDFNNLLMGITGCSDVALSKLAADNDARRYIEEIKKAALRGSSLTGQLLAFSRKREAAPRVVEFNAVVNEAKNLLRPLLSEDIDFVLDLSEQQLCVRCDPGQVEQVLVNLVVNARDAMPEGGVLTVSTDAVVLGEDGSPTVGELDAGEYVVLSVEDTGTGIDEETLAHIFEPFFTTKDVDRGTGLGLSTIYGIVKQSRGEIVVESQLDRGTTFELYLPRTHQTPREPVFQPEVDLQGSGEAVLVVEDESLVRLTVRGYLERGGYRVLSAKDGAEALAIAGGASEPIDLLVTDMVLPGLKGPEIACRVREHHPEVQVVYMSAFPADKLRAEGRLSHDDDALQKPFSEHDLLAEVRRALTATNTPLRSPAAVDDSRATRLDDELPAELDDDETPNVSLLLVEDHQLARWTIRELLEDEGYEVLEASSGAAAIEAISERGEPVNLVICDMKLPDLPGPAVTKRLRDEYPDLGVVYTSGRTKDDPSVREALSFDQTTFVAKPVVFDTLLEVVEQMLSTSD